MIDPTPTETWRAEIDDPLEDDLSAESLVWASPPTVPNESDPPDANL